MKRIILALAILISIQSNAQQVGVGEWRDYLPYNKGTAIAPAGSRVYVAAGNGVFYVDLSDKSITRLSKVTGLSDVGAKIVRYNKEYKTVVIGYENGNMDLIVDGKTIENYSDIKRATSILGRKTINEVMFIAEKAYISTNFGISVFDLIDKEFKETYIIGPNGANLNVNETATDGQYIYAATDIGLMKASLSNPSLVDYSNWSLITNIPNGAGKVYNAVCYVHNKLYANQSNPAFKTDTSYVFDGNVWAERDPNYHWTTTSLNASNNNLLVTAPYVGTSIYNQSGQQILSVDVSNSPGINHNEAMYDELGNLWAADMTNGSHCSNGVFGNQFFTPDGPYQKKTYSMLHKNGSLWTVPGGTLYYETTYTFGQVSRYNGIQWENRTRFTDTQLDKSWDFMNIAIDPLDPTHAYFSSWGRGLVELKDNQYYRYNSTNSNNTIIGGLPSDTASKYVCGVAFDEKGRLWLTNAFNPLGIITRGKDGVFQSLDFGNLVNSSLFLGQITINSLGQKWVILGRGAGILVFKEAANGTVPVANRKTLSTQVGNGALPDNEVRCIVEDKDGTMWVGTAKGVCIFYSPDAVLSGSGGFDAQKPGLVEGGFFYALLENEKVTCIAVDGANRKWIGTEKGGLFLVSADGSKQLKAFNTENSLLISNSILSVAVDPASGEVFVATDEGIVSYRGDATEAEDTYADKVYAFPNPVRPNYKGPISIKGLVNDADVKITDMAGRLVYQTKANGGQATWDGNGFDGERAKSGVYLVFTTNTDGSKTKVTKVMIVN